MATLDHRLNGNKWVVGTIESVLGPLMYNVRVHPNILWKRHINQIIPMLQGDESIDCRMNRGVFLNYLPKNKTPESKVETLMLK